MWSGTKEMKSATASKSSEPSALRALFASRMSPERTLTPLGIGRGDRQLIVCVPDDEPERSRIGRAMARELVAIAQRAPEGRRGWLIEEINGKPAIEDPSSQYLLEHGFASTAMGLQLRVPRRTISVPDEEDELDA